jgi:hypothetical protein
MPKGILYIESRPTSPERLGEYHTWYNETHLREVVGLDGFVSARRFSPVDDDGPFVAIYEIEADDLQAVFASLGEAAMRGDLQMSGAMQMDPPPMVRLLELTAAYASGPGTV